MNFKDKLIYEVKKIIWLIVLGADISNRIILTLKMGKPSGENVCWRKRSQDRQTFLGCNPEKRPDLLFLLFAFVF